MKESFTKNDIQYSIRQQIGKSTQYQAKYSDGTSAWTTLRGKNHTRAEVIDAINNVNERSDEN